MLFRSLSNGRNEFCVAFTIGTLNQCSGPTVSIEARDWLHTPTISDITTSPVVIHGGDRFTINARIVDDVGVRSALLHVEVTGGGPGCTNPTLISGDTRNGIWSADCALPPDAVGQAVIHLSAMNETSTSSGAYIGGVEYRFEVLPAG